MSRSIWSTPASARELAGIDVLDRYVSALGGNLQIVVSFGDEQIKVPAGIRLPH